MGLVHAVRRKEGVEPQPGRQIDVAAWLASKLVPRIEVRDRRTPEQIRADISAQAVLGELGLSADDDIGASRRVQKLIESGVLVQLDDGQIVRRE